MTVRVRYAITLGVSSTTAEEKDLGNGKFEVVDDQQGEGGAWKTTLPKNTSDFQLKLDNIDDACFLFLRTTSKDPTLDPVTITMKRNVIGGEAVPITPLGLAKEGHLLMSTSGLTALYLTNPSTTTDMEVTVFVAGD